MKKREVKKPDSTDALPDSQFRIPNSGAKGSGNFGGPLRLVVTTLAIFFISQIAAVAIVYIGSAVISPASKQSLDNSIVAQFFYVLLAEGLAVWLVLKVVKQRGLKLEDIGLGRKPTWRDLGRAAIGFLIFFAVLILVTSIVNQLSPQIVDKKQNLGFNNVNGGFQEILTFIALVIMPPLGEEILVRGYLYSGLRKVWNFVPALITTSLLFGLAHLELGSSAGLVWAAAIDTFILSVVLVYLREKTGALYAGMLVHMLNNLIAFVVLFH